MYMKRLIREVAPAAFEKCFEDRSVQNWSDGVQADIFRSAMHMTELTALKLLVRPPLNGSPLCCQGSVCWHA